MTMRPRQYPGYRSLAGCLAALLLLAGSAGCGEESDPDADRAAEIEQRAIDETNRELARRRERTETSQRAEREPAATTTTGAPGDQAGASAELLSPADKESFATLAARLPGTEGLVVTTFSADPIVQLGSLDGGAAWSTAKVPVAMAAIARSGASRADLSAAITASDNAAAERLWSSLGSPDVAASAANEQLRSSGDQNTTIESRRLRSGFTAFGQTSWSLADQARFVAGMGCTGPGREVLDLMGEVIAGQRWGLGDTGLPARFKGGWGPGTQPGSGGAWLDRQMGTIEIDGRPVVLAIATSGTDHASGTVTLTKLAAWATDHVDSSSAPSAPVCR